MLATDAQPFPLLLINIFFSGFLQAIQVTPLASGDAFDQQQVIVFSGVVYRVLFRGFHTTHGVEFFAPMCVLLLINLVFVFFPFALSDPVAVSAIFETYSTMECFFFRF